MRTRKTSSATIVVAGLGPGLSIFESPNFVHNYRNQQQIIKAQWRVHCIAKWTNTVFLINTYLPFCNCFVNFESFQLICPDNLFVSLKDCITIFNAIKVSHCILLISIINTVIISLITYHACCKISSLQRFFDINYLDQIILIIPLEFCDSLDSIIYDLRWLGYNCIVWFIYKCECISFAIRMSAMSDTN